MFNHLLKQFLIVWTHVVSFRKAINQLLAERGGLRHRFLLSSAQRRNTHISRAASTLDVVSALIELSSIAGR